MNRVWFALVLMLLVAAAPAHAHTRSQSRSSWTITGDQISARIEAESVDVTRLYALGGEEAMDAMFAQEVARTLHVSAAGEACTPAGAPAATLEPRGLVVARWTLNCPAGGLARGPLRIESALFLQVAPSHLHFLSAREGAASAEAVLTQSAPSAELDLHATPEQQSFWSTVARFTPIGAEHVWTGLDHLAFILALVLLSAGDLRKIIVAATGFTLGHTLTLGLAAIGVLRPNSASIEALIGFTIAFVALGVGAGGKERFQTWSAPVALLLALGGAAALAGFAPMSPLIWFGLAAFVYAYPRGFPQHTAWLALIFGLIHGCGFAGALSELDLPKPRLLASLFGFNLGVEIGQVVFIAATLLIGYGARKLAHGPVLARIPEFAAAALFALGLFWFTSRLAFAQG
ncbi:MAG: HupE/UreJ family protein [Hyphomonadaceae bacterium]|nr:HupE/UreJ family protein [Hyphomonadaceae bacterium]